MGQSRDRDLTSLKASTAQLQARLDLRRSSAAAPHRNKAREQKRPGKGNRNNWKRDQV
ncbi:hypothetical protein PBI_STASIA_79 [Mycobacterium phage Stasia]|uniref:Uncharacterized protein n=1 Tax=Mycobacterium phage Stasia TaxID=1897548 RepID=A0A1D8EUK2_9CAUD|nr:hypothetical protein KIY68_gp14 [Mycobacterium phage Stasia]AOT24735.1 hypothetical protein PBI_STASIA_79 [Mycobacterium phage Stasia]